MASSKDKWHKHPLLIAVIGALILAPIGAGIADGYKQRPVLTTISGWIRGVYHGFASIMGYGVKVWIIIISIAILIFVRKLIKLTKRNVKPILYGYTKDSFNGLTWRWQWEQNEIDLMWDIKNLVPYCPYNNCDTQLVHSRRQGYAWDCPRCKQGISNFDYTPSEEIKILIKDTLRKKYNQ